MKKTCNQLFTIIFIISQLYWLFWIALGIYLAITYGTETVGWTLLFMVSVTTQTPFVLILIYQVIFCLIGLAKKFAKMVQGESNA